MIAPADYGSSPDNFRENDLLNEYKDVPHFDWFGSTWPPNVLHKDLWDLVGGYSIEFSPGMYSDPDFSAKLWMVGVRYFKGISKSRVYHFEARSTSRIKKNKGNIQFLFKWGITSASFMRNVLRRGKPFDKNDIYNINIVGLKKDLLRSKIKRVSYLFSNLTIRKIWEK